MWLAASASTCSYDRNARATRISGPVLTSALPWGLPHDLIAPPPSGDEPWGPVWPDNVQETGVSPGGRSGSPHRGRRGQAGRANSKKDVVTVPIRGFCALHAPR